MPEIDKRGTQITMGMKRVLGSMRQRCEQTQLEQQDAAKGDELSA
jgi:hypothetical protein